MKTAAKRLDIFFARAGGGTFAILEQLTQTSRPDIQQRSRHSLHCQKALLC
jgi:hypothetical protein